MRAMTNNVRGTQKKRKHIQSKYIAQGEGHESLNAVFEMLLLFIVLFTSCNLLNPESKL